MTSSPKLPIFRISLTNATVLSGLYLVAAATIEVVRARWNPHWADRASLAMEAFPARALEVLGLWRPLKQAVAEGGLTSFQVRLIFGLTSALMIFVMGLLVGLAMWGVSKLGRAEGPPAR